MNKLGTKLLKAFHVCSKQIIRHESCDELSDIHATIKHIKTARYKGTVDLPVSKYGGTFIVTMLPGHGIGPEMMEHIKDVYSILAAPVDFEIIDIDDGVDQIKNAITSIRRNGCCIKGNLGSSKNPEVVSANVSIRKKLDLYVCYSLLKSYKNVRCKYNDIDIILVRQNTEGEYSMMEHENKDGVVESMKITTAFNSDRLANWAVTLAKFKKRRKITIVHKAPMM